MVQIRFHNKNLAAANAYADRSVATVIGRSRQISIRNRWIGEVEWWFEQYKTNPDRGKV